MGRGRVRIHASEGIFANRADRVRAYRSPAQGHTERAAGMLKRSGQAAFAAAVMVGAINSAEAVERVGLSGGVQPGTIVVRTGERRLYLVVGEGQALRYPVAVGRVGKQWAGL